MKKWYIRYVDDMAVGCGFHAKEFATKHDAERFASERRLQNYYLSEEYKIQPLSKYITVKDSSKQANLDKCKALFSQIKSQLEELDSLICGMSEK